MYGKKAKCPKCSNIMIIPVIEERDTSFHPALSTNNETVSYFNFSCPRCGQNFSVEASMLGKNAVCPKCFHVLNIPMLEQKNRSIEPFYSTAEGVCPYCKSDITKSDSAAICPICNTPHHAECWRENNGCTVYGCEMAPQDEEKIMINLKQPYQTEIKGSRSQVRPWIRYWARMMDIFLFSFLWGFFAHIIFVPLFYIPDTIINMLTSVIYIFIEPIMLCLLGTTPGKALLKIKLRKENGAMLTYTEALSRTFNVWIRGQGLGIPFIALFTHIAAFNKLKREGKTSWDQDGKYIVTHQILGPLRIFSILIFILIIFILIVIATIEN